MSSQEKKDKRFSMTMSIIVHGSLLLIFFFLVAWREPDPPIPEYGIEINFGQQETGGGNTERETETEIEDTVEEEAPDSEVETEEVEEIVEETPEEVTEEEVTEPVEETTPPVEETEPEPVETEEVIEKPVTTPEKAEVKVEEEPKKEEVKPVEEKKEETKPEEEKKVEEKPVEKPKTVDERAIMGGKKTNNNTTDPASNNQGDDPDKKGNAGDPKGKKETKGNSPGGADLGVSYSLDGWKWQRPPAEKDDSQVEGTIKFAIDVDDRGQVLRVSTIPGTTISDNTIIEFYKKQVQKLSFVQLDPTKAPAAISKGEVTFVIKTN